jgi:uncharacterized protein
MMCVELAFTADPQRLQARPAHRWRLTKLHHDGVLLAAGPWADDSGALLIFNVGEQELQAELSTDPYYSTPGVTIASIHAWAPIVGPRTAPDQASKEERP